MWTGRAVKTSGPAKPYKKQPPSLPNMCKTTYKPTGRDQPYMCKTTYKMWKGGVVKTSGPAKPCKNAYNKQPRKCIPNGPDQSYTCETAYNIWRGGAVKTSGPAQPCKNAYKKQPSSLHKCKKSYQTGRTTLARLNRIQNVEGRCVKMHTKNNRPHYPSVKCMPNGPD